MNGIYVLIIHVDKDIKVNVGALGTVAFEKGLYAYVGSAQTNLEQRIKRHLKKEKHKFWHIDYLLNNPAAKITKIYYKKANKTEECKIAASISQNAQAIANFGSSDCKCKTHLYHIKNHNILQKTMQTLPHNITLFKRQPQEYVVHQKRS